ncbi:MAG: PEGA domain-containing protein, partial [Deltaproteobacteria bacterium]|nr:PEGA domain-containing protein [Deltaproteobacteria bacterium]
SSGIIITSDPSFEVMVDGKKVGKTPLTIENLPAGTHDVTFIDPEGGNATQTVELAEGEFKKAHYASSPDSSDARM